MQRAVVILAIIVGVLLLKDAFFTGGIFGWFARASFDENYVVLPKSNGVPVVPSHQTVIVNRGGGAYEVPADQGNLPQIIIRPPAVQQPQVTAPAPATQPAPQQGPHRHRQPPAPEPCTPQTGCPGDDGFQPIEPRN